MLSKTLSFGQKSKCVTQAILFFLDFKRVQENLCLSEVLIRIFLDCWIVPSQMEKFDPTWINEDATFAVPMDDDLRAAALSSSASSWSSYSVTEDLSLRADIEDCQIQN